jgi:hypothetical protein
VDVIELPRISELMLTQMAEDWVDNRIFSDKHLPPRDRQELIKAVFPAVAPQLANAVILRDCGLVFELYELRSKERMVRVGRDMFPVFDTCKMLHRDQVFSLQEAVDAIKLTRGRKLVLAN